MSQCSENITPVGCPVGKAQLSAQGLHLNLIESSQENYPLVTAKLRRFEGKPMETNLVV